MSATAHLLRFPRLKCNHQGCKHAIVPEDNEAIRLLKDQDNWWSVTFVGSFVSLFVHCGATQHRDDVLIIPCWCADQDWDTIDVDSKIKKIIVLELTRQHYTMSVLHLENKTI